eukprot:8857598-Prorocentrum_lima.AAC.1
MGATRRDGRIPRQAGGQHVGDVVNGRQECFPHDVANMVLCMHHSLLESRVKRFVARLQVLLESNRR